MSLILQSSGGGQITIQEPATASNFTQTLPAVTGTVVVTGTTPTLNGITFPATQVPSADANTLDDYEEGTFTPSVVGQSTAGTFTYSTREGRYTKIGNVVSVQIAIYVSATSVSASGAAFITGLPFALNSTVTFTSFNIGWVGNITFSGFLSGYGDATTTQFLLRESVSGTFGGIVGGTQLGGSFYIFASTSYLAQN
jgi:hypothetical protein